MKTLKPFLLIAAAAVLFSSCGPKKSSDTAATTGSAGILLDTIPVSVAQEMVNNFNGRAYHIKRAVKPKDTILVPDTRCVWFDIATLKKLVDSVAAEGGDGIRFYSSAYGKKQMPRHRVDSSYLDHATLVMVSTRDSAGFHWDYYTPGKVKGKPHGFMALPVNQGELCPPPEKCKTIGATLLGDK
jgi:hypothetical protein